VSAPGIKVVQLDPLADARWDEFVNSSGSSSIYHLGLWSRVLRRTYGFKPEYLAVETDGRLAGVLPLAATRGVVSGTRLRSLPALGAVDPIAISTDATAALLAEACGRTERAGARSWTLRARGGGYEQLEGRLCVSSRFHTFVAPLPEDPDALRASWKKTSNNLWRSLKKADQAGVTVRAATAPEDLRRFYGLYLRTMRHHRSLPRSYTMFKLARELLSPLGHYRLLLAEHDGEVVAGGVFYTWRDTIDLAFNASSQRHLELRPNHAVYWEAIRWAIESGYSAYNMGDAPVGGSLARFKSQWGGEPVDRFQYEYAPGGRSGAVDALRRASASMDSDAARESLASKLWGRAPLIATRVAGSLVYRAF
jgi:hypothetical protein